MGTELAGACNGLIWTPNVKHMRTKYIAPIRDTSGLKRPSKKMGNCVGPKWSPVNRLTS